MTQTDYFGENLSRSEKEARREARETKQTQDNRRLGLLIFQISWMMAFVALVVVNWQLRFQYETWPPPNVRAMGVALPTVATLLLLGGVVAARRALRALEANALETFRRLWWILLGTGVVFVVIIAYEWWHVGAVDVTNSQYQSVFRLMTGFHMLHAVVIGAFIGNILIKARLAHRHPDDEDIVRYGPENTWAVEAAVGLWNFVFVAWLLFYVVLYWWRSA